MITYIQKNNLDGVKLVSLTFELRKQIKMQI